MPDLRRRYSVGTGLRHRRAARDHGESAPHGDVPGHEARVSQPRGAAVPGASPRDRYWRAACARGTVSWRAGGVSPLLTRCRQCCEDAVNRALTLLARLGEIMIRPTVPEDTP